MTDNSYGLGDIAVMRKKHPCGSFEWEIIRLGADIKIRCCGCGHTVMLPRTKFNKSVKNIIVKQQPDKVL